MKPFLKIQQHTFIAIPKKSILLALFIILYTTSQAQSLGWMLGSWKSRSEGSVTNTIQINDVSGDSFTGIKTSEIGNTKITIAISGTFRARLYLQNGDIISKTPANAATNDCSACVQSSKMIIRRDSVMLVTTIINCDARCDGETFYYRLLPEFDSSTQQYLVNRFGKPSDILAFQPYKPLENKPLYSNVDTPKTEVAVASTVTNEKRLQRINDSTRIAQQKKRQQQTDDSLKNVARLRQQRADSTLLAQQKIREKEIADSLNLAQQKEQQRIKDSLDNVAKLEQLRQRTEDSLRDVQAKKRQQEIADSINLAQQKEQQRLKDSLDNVARLRQQQIADSTLLAQQKIREKEIADSLSLAQQKEQQRIKDSLDNVARLEQIRLRTEDSLRDVLAKKRQQEMEDSLNLAAKRQQEITDSLAALRKQQIEDSLQKVALAKAVPPADTTGDKVLTSRGSVLLGTYHIATPDILIELFDNGEIDGDIVSVYHNNEMIVSSQTLGTKPITLNIHADADHRQHEFVMTAENLGSIPPNSALMRVTAGKQSYKLSVNTDLKTNARIIFIYDGN